MIITTDILVKITVFVLGVCGAIVARHIHKHKKPNQSPLVCPMNFDCHSVVHSDYSKFLSVPVEIFGMVYYITVAVSYGVFIILPHMMSPLSVGIMVILSLTAFLFSIYLISIQLFVLKKGCFWCYISSLISILIFALTLLAYNFPTIAWSLIR